MRRGSGDADEILISRRLKETATNSPAASRPDTSLNQPLAQCACTSLNYRSGTFPSFYSRTDSLLVACHLGHLGVVLTSRLFLDIK